MTLWNIMTSPEGIISGALWVATCGIILAISLVIAWREKAETKPDSEPVPFTHEWSGKNGR